MDWFIYFISPVLVLWLALLGPPIIAIYIPVYLQKRAYKNRLNPLTKSMRRPPGSSLLKQIIDLDFELINPLMVVTMIAPCMISLYYIFTEWMDRPGGYPLIAALVAMCVFVYIYHGRKILQMRTQLHSLRLGYECELAAAQELDQLMLHGYRIFHDIPADGFNIDHLVVGPNGVFAVETKGRSKKDKGAESRKEQAKLRYDGKALHFPDKVETGPIKQTLKQAKWVSQWLTSATGMQVMARPVLVLPGWYINWPRQKTAVAVLPGKKLDRFFLANSNNRLSEEQMKRIVYQVNQKVNDLEPGTVARVN